MFIVSLIVNEQCLDYVHCITVVMNELFITCPLYHLSSIKMFGLSSLYHCCQIMMLGLFIVSLLLSINNVYGMSIVSL